MRTSNIFRGMLIPAALFSVMGCSSESPTDPNTPNTKPAGTDPAPTGSETPAGDPANGVFESAHPSGAADGSSGGKGGSDPNTGSASVSDGAPASGTPGATPPSATATTAAPSPMAPGDNSAEATNGSGDAARAIEEADVIKREGDRLYALSAYGGLTVVDISDPDDLSILGRYRSTATPFEMYVRDQTVFVLYNGYGEYTYDDKTESYTYFQTSYVIALDTSDAKNITEDQKFEISGYIADSRLVGDALYVVAYDDSYCYRCGDKPETNVLSLNVSDPHDIVKVDELNFEERQDDYSWRRSLSGNDQRLYIAGPRYGNGSEPEGSVIQVVDISDPGGDMQAGDSLEVAGQINSRWQMDEYEGVLRVVSQPMWWRASTPPTVETFQINSSDDLTELGSLELQLPQAEALQAVRFDGDRGYAITFQQTDPLFTIDLSVPEAPVQAGQLQMPGWIYYMEPRGDRLVGLGFDQGNADGGLTVSLFDVSDLTTPTMIDRVNFGGQWAQLAEDQDRIQKSFQVLDSDELILVPFSGWTYDENTDKCSYSQTYQSGVQLIDWADDALSLRGVAESKGQARRAFLYKDRLLTMSDERLEAFDVSDRDAPDSTSKVDLAQIVTQLEVAGDSVVRIGSDWWTSNGLEATVSSLDELVSYQPGKTVTLPDAYEYTCYTQSNLSQVMSGGDNVYFLYSTYDWSNNDSQQAMKVVTLNAADPTKPVVAGEGELDFFPNNGRAYVPGMVDNGASSLGVGDSLVFASHNIEYNNLGFVTKNQYSLEVVDLSNADKPKRTSIAMPDSLGSTGLLASGKVIATSHFETSPDNAENVRFYLDRLDLSDEAEPKLMKSINIPGSLLAYDSDTSRALTIDYTYVNFASITPKQCYEEEFGTFLTTDPNRQDWETSLGPCTALRFKLNLVDIGKDKATLLGSQDVDKGMYISTVAIGDDRVFLGTSSNNGYYYGGGIAVDVAPSPGISIGIGGGYIGYGYYPVQTGEARLLVASGLQSGDLSVASAQIEVTDSFYGFSQLLAKGKKAVVAAGWQGQMSVIDATDADKPVVSSTIELAGYVNDMALVGDVAVAALGTAGVQTLSLGE